MFPGREEPASPVPRIKRRSFATTHWSVVLATRDTEPDRARQALEQLCATYWYPIYACIRGYGKDHHAAEDLTQGFWALLLSNQALQHLDPAGGRLRSFLWVALKQYLHKTHDHESRQKRAGNKPHLSLDALSALERYQLEPVDRHTPEQLFERRWALALLDTALQRLKTETTVARHPQLFDYLKDTIQGASGGPTHAELGRLLGMSPGAVAVTVHRLRQRFAELCREAVAHTVDDPAEVDEELDYLLKVLGD
jgi:RNA polymerase sigma factor (sigma-70 family)